MIGRARILARRTSRRTLSHQAPFPLAIGGVARETSIRYNFFGNVNSVVWNDGMERWNGLLDWSTGLDYWSARPQIDCILGHTPKAESDILCD